MDQQLNTSLTAAEEAMVETYLENVGRMAGTPQIAHWRDESLDYLKTRGLPTRKIESWHFTDLRRLLTEFHPLAKRPDFHEAQAIVENYPHLVDATNIPVLDGFYIPELADSLQEGITLRSFAQEAENGSDLSAWWKDTASDVISALNTAFVRDGLSIEIAAGQKIEQPLGIANAAVSQNPSFAAIRNVVKLSEGSQLTLIERYLGDNHHPVQRCPVTQVRVEKGASLLWLVLQEGDQQTTHLSQLQLSIAEDANVSLYIVNTGGKLVRHEINAEIVGQESDFQLRGVNLLAGNTHSDVTMVLDHRVPASISQEIVRNVVTDKAQGVFQGQIRVHPKAQKTDARMACNTLLLSDEGAYSAKPELEIFADDVQCGHGATVTEIDENQLFYLMSRGIEKRLARQLLIKAFVKEIIDELEDEELISALENRLFAWFERHE